MTEFIEIAMRKICFTLLLFFFSVVGFAQSGSVSGNAFWKYNEYVGNRADAGDTVYLIPAEDPSTFKSAATDLTGNFKFENVKHGKYLVVIISSNTLQPVELNIKSTHVYRKYFNSALLDTVVIKYQEYDVATKAKAKIKELKHKRKNVEAKEKEYFTSVVELGFSNPPSFSLRLGAHPYSPKLFFKEIQVTPNETQSIVADFGLTYL